MYLCLTSYTGVIDLQIVFQFVVARTTVLEGRFYDVERTRPSSGAPLIQDVQDVNEASDEPEVSPDAASDPHPSVDGATEHEHFVSGTRDLESREMTEFLRFLRTPPRGYTEDQTTATNKSIDPLPPPPSQRAARESQDNFRIILLKETGS